MRTIKQFVVRLSDEEHESLKQIAFEGNKSIQQLFNEMVKRYLEEHREQMDTGTIHLSTKVSTLDTKTLSVKEALFEVAEKMKELGELIQEMK